MGCLHQQYVWLVLFYLRVPSKLTKIQAGILGLTFPRMTTVMTPTGACESKAFGTSIHRADNFLSRFLRRPQSYSVVHDLLLRPRDQAAHVGGIGPYVMIDSK